MKNAPVKILKITGQLQTKGVDLILFRASKSTVMGESTTVHQQILKHFSKTVGTTPLFQRVKISKPSPSSPSLVFTLATILYRKSMKSVGNSRSHT
jgi:hypothetical protein